MVKTNYMWATTQSELDWLREHNNKFTYFISEAQYAEYKADCKKKYDEAIAAEKKENREATIIAIIVMVVIVLLIWGLLAAIAEGCGVGISGVLFAIFFFPAILMAAKG